MTSSWKEAKVRGILLRVALGVGVLISLLIAGVSHPARAGQATDLERAAKKDGRLRMVVFPSIRPAADAFEKKYGIKVEGTYVGDPDILRKVSTESQAGVFATDIFTTSPGPTGSHLNKWTMPYNPAGFEKVEEVKKALPAEWNQIPMFNHVVGVLYNKELVPPQQVPTSIFDLLKPEFKGKIISRTPWLGSNFLVGILSYFTWFERDMKKWQDYWTRFRSNVGRYEAGFPALHFAVGLKEYSMAVFTLTYTSSLWGGTYPSIAFATFKEGGIWWPNMVAIHKNAEHPNAAKLFVNYLISEEGQKIFADGGNLPATKDVPPKPEIKEALKGVKLLNGTLQPTLVKELEEREGEWKARVQKIFQ
jgi:ABC-type Fe3+ transport system substrate-binding protein